MLKFSGFADLTSCLGESGIKPEGKESFHARQRKACEMPTCLLAGDFPYALNASKASESTQMHRHARQPDLASQESAVGMRKSRH